MNNIYLTSLRDGKQGHLPNSGDSRMVWKLLLKISLTSIKNLVLRTMLIKVKTFISNPRKALNSDWLSRKVQRAHILDRRELYTVTPLVYYFKIVVKSKHRCFLGRTYWATWGFNHETSLFLSSVFITHNSVTRYFCF